MMGPLDRATTELYHRLRSSPRNAAIIARIESAEPESEVCVEAPPRVVVMPGAFHREYPQTGADGGRVGEIARELGWPVDRVAVPSLAPMAANAQRLVDHLASLSDEPVILVSLSKGGADVRTALDRPHAAQEMRNVRAWLNISGMVCGTPLVQWLGSHPLRCLGVRLLLRLRRQRFADIKELAHGERSHLCRPLVLPRHMRVIHVVGFPLVGHLSNDWARRGHARLAPLGPNDGGGVLLSDFVDLPGSVYPVWGADHYLNPPWNVTPLLRRLLVEAARMEVAVEVIE